MYREVLIYFNLLYTHSVPNIKMESGFIVRKEKSSITYSSFQFFRHFSPAMENVLMYQQKPSVFKTVLIALVRIVRIILLVKYAHIKKWREY